MVPLLVWGVLRGLGWELVSELLVGLGQHYVLDVLGLGLMCFVSLVCGFDGWV